MISRRLWLSNLKLTANQIVVILFSAFFCKICLWFKMSACNMCSLASFSRILRCIIQSCLGIHKLCSSHNICIQIFFFGNLHSHNTKFSKNFKSHSLKHLTGSGWKDLNTSLNNFRNKSKNLKRKFTTFSKTGDSYRLNTLAHYKVTDDALVSLVPKQQQTKKFSSTGTKNSVEICSNGSLKRTYWNTFASKRNNGSQGVDFI